MTFTDYFDNPINVGDEIVYPACVRSSAYLNRVTVDTIVPLIPHPDSRHQTLVRADHASKRAWDALAQFRTTTGWRSGATPIPDKHRFVLVVRNPDSERRWTVTNIRNVIVVPKGV